MRNKPNPKGIFIDGIGRTDYDVSVSETTVIELGGSKNLGAQSPESIFKRLFFRLRNVLASPMAGVSGQASAWPVPKFRSANPFTACHPSRKGYGFRMLNIRSSLILASLAFCGSSHASSQSVEACLASAAAYHRVELSVLRAIAMQESSLNPKAIGKNTNGTYDRGLMQINDWWLPKLAKHGITADSLFDPCVSAYVGAWILSMEIKRHGHTWKAVGSYHSPTLENQMKYAKSVHRQLFKQASSAQ